MLDSPFGIYVHVPFCSHRCPYCAFVLIESDGSLHGRFVSAIEKQLLALPALDAATLYFGGGTPSMLEPDQVGRLVRAVGHLKCAPTREVTLEANPDGLGLPKLRGYRDAGINRLTLGVQSLDEGALRFLGRTHEPRQAIEAYHAARAAGFRNLCIDLIFGWPGQSVTGWTAELKRWAGEGAEHISIYGLTVEKGTELARAVKGGLEVPGDIEQGALYRTAMDVLQAEGYRHYELSNFARPGSESRHNAGYWDGRPYLGFGPGAHSYEPHRRWANVSNVADWLRRAEAGEGVTMTTEDLTTEQRMLERIFLGLRRIEGIFVPDFEDEFGVVFRERYAKALDASHRGGWVEWSGGFLRLTRSGKLLADGVIGNFA